MAYLVTPEEYDHNLIPIINALYIISLRELPTPSYYIIPIRGSIYTTLFDNI